MKIFVNWKNNCYNYKILRIWLFASGLEKNVCYEGNRFMEKADNEMYALVDEEFLAKFSNQHLNYMKKLYYSFYAGYCISKEKMN